LGTPRVVDPLTQLPAMHSKLPFETMIVQQLSLLKTQTQTTVGLFRALSFSAIVLNRKASEARDVLQQSDYTTALLSISSIGGRRMTLSYTDTQKDIIKGEWTCAQCTFVNDQSSTQCILCAGPYINGFKDAEIERQNQLLVAVKVLGERIANLGLQQMAMVDDGNCLFRAVSYQLFRAQTYHSQLRRLAVRHIEEHKSEYMPYFEDDDNFSTYVDRMSTPGTWGDEITLHSLSSHFGVNIHVITSTTDNWYLTYHCSSFSSASSSLLDYTTKSTEQQEQQQHSRDIFLAYISPIHYNSITHIAEDSKYIAAYTTEKYTRLLEESKLYEMDTPFSAMAQVRAEFERFDTNKDGFLTKEEIELLFREYFGNANIIDETIAKWDMLDDNRISFDEFAVIFQNCQQSMLKSCAASSCCGYSARAVGSDHDSLTHTQSMQTESVVSGRSGRQT
jgi:hypothetical protein